LQSIEVVLCPIHNYILKTRKAYSTGPIELPGKGRKEVILREDSLLRFKGKLRWRKETGNEYSIASKRNHHNIVVVNEEMFKFVSWLENTLPLTLNELAIKCSASPGSTEFIEILRTIINKEFVSIDE
jgi:hypothetical protein